MTRDRSVDIAKGLGIILMVMGHAGMPHSSIIFRFHMALFFILSGWCFSDKYLDGIKNVLTFVWKKIKGLYIPFVLFNGGTLLLRGVFIKLNIYTNNEMFLEESPFGGNAYGIFDNLHGVEIKNYLVNVFKFAGESQLGGATWFLRVMFGVTVMWCLVNAVLKSVAKFDEKMRMCINISLSVFLVFVSWNWMQNDKHFPLQFDTVASAYIMFCIGYYLKKYYCEFNWTQNVVIIVMASIILLYCDGICNINGWDSNVNIFSNPFMYIVTSLAGFFGVFSIAQVICCLKKTQVLETIGRHTLSILMFHFLCFKVVNLIQVIRYKHPFYRIASFPVYNSRGKWWVIYTIIGIMIPVFMAIIFEKIKLVLNKDK